MDVLLTFTRLKVIAFIIITANLCTSRYKSLPPKPGTSGALAGDSQHFVSILVNQVISKANESYFPLCPGSGGEGIYIDWCIRLWSLPMGEPEKIVGCTWAQRTALG